MKGSFKILEVAGITINMHITFIMLIGILAIYNPKSFFFVIALFFFVTIHELAHSLVAKRFGIGVKEITLLPIGGVAAMQKMPEKPYQEFLISIAGPLTNIMVIVIFYFPLKAFIGPEIFFGTLKYVFSGQIPQGGNAVMIAEIYWLNLVLAAFNLLPAFPMDGGRILRSLLAGRLGFRRATKVAVNFGHAFAILFGYIGITQTRLLLIIIAVFIYMSASSEEMQVDVKTILKRFKVRDILYQQFLTLQKDAVFSKVMELIFQTRQEDFPIMDESNENMIGFVTRDDIMKGVHQLGMVGEVSSIMRTDVPSVNELAHLDDVHTLMQTSEIRALPVLRDNKLVGLVTIDDLNRVLYSMMNGRG